VKGYSLPEVAPAIVGTARAGATIIPLLNGVDAATRLESLGVPRGRVAGGLARISVVRTSPGVVERKSPIDEVTVGSFPGDDDGLADEQHRLSRLVAALAAVGTTATLSADITRDLWRKLAFIVPMNVICGLCRTGMGAPLSTERGRWLMAGSLSEIVAVSRAAGGNLSDEDYRLVHEGLLQVPGHVKPSFLLDLERGGPTELEMLAGAVSRLGREHGVPTPIHDVATAAFEAAILPS
jgi:2-dehydropantoate 2-reductase